MSQRYELVFRDARTILLDQISLPELDGHFDYTPYIQFNEKGERVWSNLMSGTWAWDEAVCALASFVSRFMLNFL
jgi:hypothetical protein